MKKKILMFLLLSLIIVGASVGIFAFGLEDLQKADGTGSVKHISTQYPVKIPNTYETQDTDFRAVWISHLVGDFPSYSSKEQYMAEVEKVFNVMEYYNLNAMIFHIRTHNNALYKSALNPVASYYRTVNFDTWDPLEWIIDECHKRGIEFHAWMNPYRVSSSYPGTVQDYAATQPSYNAASNPDLLLKSGSNIIFNPGEPAVRSFIVDTVMEVIENYNVDAIHFDDYFYVSGVDDTVTRNKYNTNNLSLANFRREQVDLFIEDLHQTMENYNLSHGRSVQLGISPSGIYRSGSYVPLSSYQYDSNGNLTYPLFSNTTSTFEHYGDYLYSDTKKWVDNEWIDYILPQLYWSFEHPSAAFADLADWWSGVVKNKDVNLYLGMGLYMIIEASNTYSWKTNNKEAYNEILYGTKHPEIKGHSIYSYKHLKYAYEQTNNALFYQNFSKVKTDAWSNKAILPEIKTLNPINLPKVQNLSVNQVTDGYTINFNKVNNTKFYVIYRSTNPLEYNSSEVVDVIGAYDSEQVISFKDTVASGNYFYGVKPMSYTNTLGAAESVSTLPKLTVTFKNYDGSILKVETVNSGASATAPIVPQRDGYNFSGWDKSFTEVTSDLEVTALYTPIVYQVRFVNYDDTPISTTQVNFGEDAIPPTPPVRSGYTFSGWDTSFTNVTSDLTVKAVYLKNEPTQITVTFKNFDGTILKIENVNSGGNATAPVAPSREGYTFSGWDKTFTNVTSSIEVIALYQIKTYQVVFVNYDDSVLLTVQVEHGKTATPPSNPVRYGYTFVGWDSSFTYITSPKTIKAIYTISTYKVQFVDYDGKVLSTTQVEHGKSAMAPSNPTRIGYNFTGWDKSFTNITSSLTVTALYTIKQYSVTFKDGSQILDTVQVNHGGNVETANPSKVGYTFVNWDKPLTNITGNIIINAIFAINKYQVQFVDYDGTIISTVQVNHGSKATAPSNPLHSGYKFVGWDTDFSSVTGDLVVKARYQDVYIISFRADGLEVYQANNLDTFDIPIIPNKEGYDQVAPYWNRTDFENITTDIVVEAIYTINKYNVKFFGYNQELLREETVEWKKAATAPEAPNVKGYEFKNWNQDFSEVTFNMDVYAVYNDVKGNVLFSCKEVNITAAIATLGMIILFILRRKRY